MTMFNTAAPRGKVLHLLAALLVLLYATRPVQSALVEARAQCKRTDRNWANVDGSTSVGAMSYAWEQTAGPPAKIENANKAIAKVTGLKEGITAFALTVTGKNKETSYREIEVVAKCGSDSCPEQERMVNGVCVPFPCPEPMHRINNQCRACPMYSRRQKDKSCKCDDGYISLSGLCVPVGIFGGAVKPPKPPMPKGYDNTCENFGVYYKLHTQRKTYADGQKACKAEGGILVEPRTKEEADCLFTKFMRYPRKTYTYIGYQNPSGKKVVSGVDGRETTVINHRWYPGEPNGRPPHICIHIWERVPTLNDHVCNLNIEFVCEIRW